MSTKFQRPCHTLATGIVFSSSPLFAGQGMGVSYPVEHLESQDGTDAFGQRRINENVVETFPSPLNDVPAIGYDPTLASKSSGGAADVD